MNVQNIECRKIIVEVVKVRNECWEVEIPVMIIVGAGTGELH